MSIDDALEDGECPVLRIDRDKTYTFEGHGIPGQAMVAILAIIGLVSDTPYVTILEDGVEDEN